MENDMDNSMQDKIAQRAYELWQAEGCPPDRDSEFWFRAEREVTGGFEPGLTGAMELSHTGEAGEQAAPSTQDAEPARAAERRAASR